jgi:hypothetical protein
MNLSRISQLKEYSLGIITEHKVVGSDFAFMTPIEEFSLEDEALVENTREYESRLPNINGVTKVTKIKGSSIIKAKWIPFGESNRDTAPDVRKNETVMIYRFADTQDYYWTTIMREPELRRLEHVRYAFCNKPSGLDPYDAESSYWIEWSTMEKRIRLHTSDNDGEACRYDFTINTADGTVKLEDSLGHYLFLDSPAGLFHGFTNTEIRLESNTIKLIANHVINDTPLVTNTGDERTEGTSMANVHVNCT